MGQSDYHPREIISVCSRISVGFRPWSYPIFWACFVFRVAGSKGRSQSREDPVWRRGQGRLLPGRFITQDLGSCLRQCPSLVNPGPGSPHVSGLLQIYSEV